MSTSIQQLIAAIGILLCCGCEFTPKKNFRQLEVGIPRQEILKQWGPPSRQLWHHQKSVDVYAWYQGYTRSGQLAKQTAETTVAVGGVVLVAAANAAVESALNNSEESIVKSSDDPKLYENWSAEQQSKQREQARLDRATEEQQRREQQLLTFQMEQGLATELDYDPEIRHDILGEPVRYLNPDERQGGVPIMLALNYDQHDRLESIAFQKGFKKAQNDLNHRSWGNYFVRKLKRQFQVQPLSDSVFSPYATELSERDFEPLPPVAAESTQSE
jgi:hypothetical protein